MSLERCVPAAGPITLTPVNNAAACDSPKILYRSPIEEHIYHSSASPARREKFCGRRLVSIALHNKSPPESLKIATLAAFACLRPDPMPLAPRNCPRKPASPKHATITAPILISRPPFGPLWSEIHCIACIMYFETQFASWRSTGPVFPRSDP